MNRTSTTLVLALASFSLLSSCVSDVKGNMCGILDAYADEQEDDVYCFDPDAREDCELLMEATLDAAVVCVGDLADEEHVREELESGGPDCDAAVATSKNYDACLDVVVEGEPCAFMDEESPCPGAVLTN